MKTNNFLKFQLNKNELKIINGANAANSNSNEIVEYYIDPVTGLKAIKQKGIGSAGRIETK
jgi:hypothetical protein